VCVQTRAAEHGWGAFLGRSDETQGRDEYKIRMDTFSIPSPVPPCAWPSEAVLCVL
jgi:hypothetical protein